MPPLRTDTSDYKYLHIPPSSSSCFISFFYTYLPYPDLSLSLSYRAKLRRSAIGFGHNTFIQDGEV
jgi:hypothetical protein